MIAMTDLSIIAKLVNRFGDGKHVIATPGTLQFFEDAYITRCIHKALQSGRLSFADMAEAKQRLDPDYRPKRKPKTLVHY